MLLQDSLASGMHNAGGRADLGVAVGVDVVHQEIDQAALFLEHREEADNFGIGAGAGGAGLAGSACGFDAGDLWRAGNSRPTRTRTDSASVAPVRYGRKGSVAG